MTKRSPSRPGGEILQGTLDLLILQTLARGHTIAHVIEHRSEDMLQVEHGSLYPASRAAHLDPMTALREE
jgi:PadR family transcriptional regulator PadR